MATKTPKNVDQIRLNHRIRNFYRCYNENDWQACFDRLDPKLREGKVELGAYAELLSSFFEKRGPIKIDRIELRLYMSAESNKHDDRPFAYGTVYGEITGKGPTCSGSAGSSPVVPGIPGWSVSFDFGPQGGGMGETANTQSNLGAAR